VRGELLLQELEFGDRLVKLDDERLICGRPLEHSLLPTAKLGSRYTSAV